MSWEGEEEEKRKTRRRNGDDDGGGNADHFAPPSLSAVTFFLYLTRKRARCPRKRWRQSNRLYRVTLVFVNEMEN